MQFTQAIVRLPSPSIMKGLTTSAELGAVDYQKACFQHQQYIETLQGCGLEVTILEPLDDFPDACFVEDPAILCQSMAIVARPGAPSRLQEVDFIEPILHQLFADKTYSIQAPAYLDGGDILQIENHFYIGLSARTNHEGAKQFSDLVSQENYTSSIVEFDNMLHLKTGISYIGNQCILINNSIADHPEFLSFDKIIVDEDEAYAANAIRVNDFFIMAKGFAKTIKRVKEKGFQVLEVDVSEFRKIDGGLSCLSLRF